MPAPGTAIPLDRGATARSRRTRERLLRESARLFVERGFENVSVEDIIAAAGVARSSFYRLFSNREHVLANIIRPVFDRGIGNLEAIDGDRAVDIMNGVFATYLDLWHASSAALRLATRVGGVHFYLFQDRHNCFRETLAELIDRVVPAGVLLNGSADYTCRLLARTAVPVMEVYAKDPDFEELFMTTMHGLLLKPRLGTAQPAD